MLMLVFARLESVHADQVELRSTSGEKLALPRREAQEYLASSSCSDVSGDSSDAHEEKMILVARSDPVSPGEPASASRSAVLKLPVLREIEKFNYDQPCAMLVRDTNNKLYAYGEISPTAEGRCSKTALREFLKQTGVAPPGRSAIDPSAGTRFASADPNDQDLWRRDYLEYELAPGDTVIGCVDDLEYDPEERQITVSLDLARYLRVLQDRPQDIFPLLGLPDAEGTQAQAVVFSTAAVESASQAGASSGSRMMVLDDDINGTLKPISSAFEDEGYQVETCPDAESARAAVEKILAGEGEDFDIALVDVNLSTGDAGGDYQGIEFARWLQGKMPHCAVILISAHDNPQSIPARVLGNLAIVDYASKPVEWRHLLAIVRRGVGRKPRPVTEFVKPAPDGDQNAAESGGDDEPLALQEISESLKWLRREINAHSVYLFKMHTVSKEVGICGYVGEAFPRSETNRRGLRYSPVRDVCEDGESFCHNDVYTLHYEKHRKLLSLCHPHKPYDSCVACPVSAPPGDEFKYGLFAFTFADAATGTRPFRITLDAASASSGTALASIRDVLVTHKAQECASRISQQLLQEWHQDTQVRQHPFLLAGLTTAGIGHDLANCLTGADSAVSFLNKNLTAGGVVTQQCIEQVSFLLNFTERAMTIARRISQTNKSKNEAPTTFDVVDAIRHAGQGVKPHADKVNTTIYYRPLPTIRLTCKQSVLYRVLYNVMLNAVQQIGLSLRKTGFIQVRHSLRHAGNGSELVIQIFDSGPGVHGYRRKRIFHPGETTRPEGSGMGLAICQQELRELAEAEIEVSNTFLFCGSCFEIRIPPKFVRGDEVTKK